MDLRFCLDPHHPNELTAVLSKTTMAGVDGVAALMQIAYDELRAPLQAAKEDWDGGFRQLVLTERDRSLFCAHAKHPEDGRVRIFRPRRLTFGPRSGPPQFCRRSAALDFVAGELLLIPSTSHVDDHAIVDKPGPSASSAHQCFVQLACLLGESLKASKAVPPRSAQEQATSSLILVGVEWSLCQDHDSIL